MIKKTIIVEAKVALWPRLNTRKIDKHYPYGNQPTNFTIAKSQDSVIKDPRVEKLKAQDPELLSGPQYSNKSSENLEREEKKISLKRPKTLKKLYLGYQS